MRRREQRAARASRHQESRALSAGHEGGLGLGLRRRVERAWYAHGLRRSGRGILDCEGVVEGITYPARLWQSEARHWTARRYIHASGMDSASVLLSWSML